MELGPGTLYGALDRLERLGLIEALPAEDRRQPYRITPAGVAALHAHLDSIERVRAAGRLGWGWGWREPDGGIAATVTLSRTRPGQFGSNNWAGRGQIAS